ncbi:unnamed protein product [Lactuca virosa]|uniref:F-box domain-containing protein n=1 Tax=Lactuca virosa TaxID=75947 RepID=A0AAU9MLH1_9ASTR|nr:unnamed protein product [Lactuca virosa]
MSNYLCEELIVEIFIRLPPKSLLRFRSLSKSWCSIISSPEFIHTHTFQSPQKFLIVHEVFREEKYFYTLHSEDQLPLCPRRGYIGIPPVEFPYRFHSHINRPYKRMFPYTRSFHIVGSCNGIVCIFDIHKNIISLWNPSVRRNVTLQGPSNCLNWVTAGFGFDTITNDYKIVRICRPKSGECVRSSHVYTMKIGTWCAIASPTPLFRDVLSKACFVNGVLHWMVECYVFELDDVDRRYILTFDLNTHVFGMIALPEPSCKIQGLSAIQGYLAVISTKHDNAWILVWRDASWSVFHKSKINLLKGGLMRVLLPTNNGDLLFNI